MHFCVIYICNDERKMATIPNYSYRLKQWFADQKLIFICARGLLMVCILFSYQVTKEKSFHKPTYKTLQSSLEAMRDHCLTHNVIGLSMPKIGCGLDGLQWYRVSGIIHQVFQDTNINVTVYSLQELKDFIFIQKSLKSNTFKTHE